MTKAEKIAAIITIYQPPESLEQLLEVISPQVEQVILVDNGQNEPIENVIWLHNPENGLAKAQNMGIAKARELGMEYVLLLDDDSLPAQDMVAKLRAAYKKLTKQGREIGIIGPYLEETELGSEPLYIQNNPPAGFRRIGFDANTPYLEDLYYVAASGSFIPMQLFDHIGEMKEEFFIYFIDTEFCLRARKAGFEIIAVRDAKMQHHFGKRSNHQLLGCRFSTTNHSADARYYMFRNRRTLWKDYASKEPGYVIFDLLRAQSEIFRVLLFEKQKLQKLQAMARGFWSR
jgi:rhamnosyltransferase